jgi:hypothetical protein
LGVRICGTRLRWDGTGLKIDKTRFLVLTGLISAAAVACTIQNTKKDESSSGGPSATNDDGGGATADASGASSATDGSATDASDAEAGAACIGDHGAEPDCAASKCPAECETIKTRFKKDVANQILGCMEMYPSCESNTSCIIERGADDPDAGRAICDDPTAAAFCQPLVDSCNVNDGEEITQESCVAMAKILTASGRDEFTSCITEGMAGYCTYGSSWCLDAMRY